MNENPQHGNVMEQEGETVLAVLQLVTGTSEGKKFWAYMLLPEEHFNAYREAVEAGGSVDLTAYGEALESGWGEMPPAEVHQRMIDEYGFDDYFEQDVIDAAAMDTEQETGGQE